MEPTLLTSLIGIAFFSLLMFLGLRLASGNWNVAADKKNQYEKWVNQYGKTIKRLIVIVGVIYYLSMLMQLSSFI